MADDDGFRLVNRRLAHVRRLVLSIRHNSNPNPKHKEQLMSDLDQATQDLSAAVTAAATRVAADIAALKAQVPANLTADVQAIEDQVTALANIDPAAPPAPPAGP